jgi:hypothetical protein
MNIESRSEIEDRTREHYLKQIKRHITSYIATANDEPQRVIKTVRTLMARCGMTRDALAQMFAEIYAASVRSFLAQPIGSVYYQPARAERFTLLKSGLL